MTDAEAVLDRFIGRYSPEVAALGRSLIGRVRTRIPQAHALVFDNYNALGIGFAPARHPRGFSSRSCSTRAG